jgi:hypothetical protein
MAMVRYIEMLRKSKIKHAEMIVSADLNAFHRYGPFLDSDVKFDPEPECEDGLIGTPSDRSGW